MIKWAVQDFGGKVLNRPIEVLTADHQNKADVAASKAREWIDSQNLAMLIGGTSSGTNLAMAGVTKEKKRPFISIGAGSARLTNEDCSPYTVHYAYDTVALAKVGGGALVKGGAKKWYFLTADYAFGHSLEADATTVVKANGGTVVGSVKHPLNASDFSSFLLQAQGSKADILAMANAGGDFVNAMKAAKEFGITKQMKVAGLLVFINDVHSVGLANAEGLQVADSWYWNQDDESRKFAKRFFDKYKRMPSSLQAADYSATTNYLKAVQKLGTTDADKVMAELKSMKYNDFYQKKGQRARRRPHDPRHVPVPGQDRQGIDHALGLLQARGQGARRPGVHHGGRVQVLAAEEVRRDFEGPAGRRARRRPPAFPHKHTPPWKSSASPTRPSSAS
jgi:branched-chain amino acid transport system substrate-binding protein